VYAGGRRDGPGRCGDCSGGCRDDFGGCGVYPDGRKIQPPDAKTAPTARKGSALALEIDPDNACAWYNKGDELGHLSRFVEAKACFENALGLWQAKGMIMKCEHVLEKEWYG